MGRHRARTNRAALATLVVSLAVLAATPAGVAATRAGSDTPGDAGSRASVDARTDDATRGDAPQPVRSDRARPVALEVPALGVRATIVGSGVTAGGGVDVPEDIGRVGWYRYGPRPGDSAGSAVLVGHRDGRTAGAGALFRLGDLGVGDRVSVIDADWKRVTFRVIARESFRKGAAPWRDLFATGGPPRLTLISCGGRFLADQGSYEDNVVVTAVPADSRAA